MKTIKIIDLILLVIISGIGIIYEIYPPIIPDWLFYTTWIVGVVALTIFGIILYIEKKDRNNTGSEG